jgi:hypothetical protein
MQSVFVKSCCCHCDVKRRLRPYVAWFHNAGELLWDVVSIVVDGRAETYINVVFDLFKDVNVIGIDGCCCCQCIHFKSLAACLYFSYNHNLLIASVYKNWTLEFDYQFLLNKINFVHLHLILAFTAEFSSKSIFNTKSTFSLN